VDAGVKGIQMRLQQLKVSGFRCYNEEIVVDLNDLVVFVGRNDAGKSTLFDALDIFFEGKPVPDKDDVCIHSNDSSIRLTCVLGDLPSELVLDAQNTTSLAAEHLLNHDGYLEVIKEYNGGLAKPKLSRIYARAEHPTTHKYHDLLSLTITKLKQRAQELDVDLSSVNQTVNAELRQAIWGHADDLGLQEVEVELNAEAAKQIWDQLKKHLPVFAKFKSDRESTDKDAEAQDPMKTAVKEAIKEQEDTLNEIAERVKTEVQAIATRTVEKLREMNPALANQLTPRVSNKNWDSLFSVSLAGDDDIPINKRGSGTRRLILLNFFRAKAESAADGKGTGVIYAIEEPETSQHPHNQIMLVKALKEIAEQPDCQVFLTTHTPMLARRFSQQSLRIVTQDADRPVIRHGQSEDTIKEIIKSLGVLPDHNIKVFFGVEGPNDVEFFRIISKILRDAGENDIPDLGVAEDSGQMVFIPLGGSSLDLWVSRLQEFNRPEFYVFDRDTIPHTDPHYKRQADDINKRENCTAWHTGKREIENYIHKDLIVKVHNGYAGAGTDFEDVPTLLAQAVHEASESDRSWEDIQTDSEKFKKKVSAAKKRLNTFFAERMTPELLTSVDTNDDVRGWLRAIGEALQA